MNRKEHAKQLSDKKIENSINSIEKAIKECLATDLPVTTNKIKIMTGIKSRTTIIKYPKLFNLKTGKLLSEETNDDFPTDEFLAIEYGKGASILDDPDALGGDDNDSVGKPIRIEKSMDELFGSI
jgi:hypothetical protein